MDSLSPALAARSAVTATPVLARPLSDGESAHLDRLRDWLRRDGTDARDVAALDARWSRLLETHPPHVPAPAGVAAALGIAIGDLLVASVTDAVWMMCPGPEGATPGVLLRDRPHMPVLPVLDAHARWRVRSSGWTVDYLQRAAAHLQQGTPRVPTQHASPDAPASPPADQAEAPVAPPAAVIPTPYVPQGPTSGAIWVPTAVPGASQHTSAPDAAPDLRPVGWRDAQAGTAPDAAPEAPADAVPADTLPAAVEEPAAAVPVEPVDEPAPAAWTPVLVEDVTPEPAPEATGWTPTLVEDDATDTEPATTGWTPTFVEDVAVDDSAAEDAGADDTVAGDADDAPAAWTPVLVEDDAEPTTPPPAWTPVLVEDDAPSHPTDTHDDADTDVDSDAVADDAPAAWTPVVVEHAEPDAEPQDAPWRPVLVEDDAPDAAPEAAAWSSALGGEPATEPAPELLPEHPASEAPAVETSVPGPVDTTPTPGRGLPVTPQRELTPEDLPHRPSERVQDLALRALELALDRAVSDPAGCAPFVLVREQYDVEVLDFPHTDAGLSQARDAARAGGYTAAAVAWTSPADATRPFARVVVDASAAGRPGIRVAHSFAHDAHGSREVGGPQVVGQAAPVL